MIPCRTRSTLTPAPTLTPRLPVQVHAYTPEPLHPYAPCPQVEWWARPVADRERILIRCADAIEQASLPYPEPYTDPYPELPLGTPASYT